MIAIPSRRRAALACLAVATVAISSACSSKPKANASKASDASTTASAAATTPTPSDSMRSTSLGGSTPEAAPATTSSTRRSARTSRTRVPVATRERDEVQAEITTPAETPANPVTPPDTAVPTVRTPSPTANPSSSLVTPPPCDSASVRVPSDTIAHITGCVPKDSTAVSPVRPPSATPSNPSATPANPTTAPSNPVNPPATPATPANPSPVSPAYPVNPVAPSNPSNLSPRDTSGRNPLDVTDPRDLGPSLANDVRIARAVMLSNSLDSAASVQAAATATNAEVKAFAELMVREHGQANVSALETVRRIDTTPPAAGGDAAGRMRAESDSGLAALAQKTGAEFDRAYIDSEVRLHQEALQRLDSEIPNVQNVDLKRLLEQARTMVSAHLERARQIQSSLSQ